MTAHSTPVLLLGSFTTALGSLRSFGAAGIPTHCITPQLPIVSASRWYSGPPGGAQPVENTADLEAYLEALDLEFAVLFPCSDEWVAAVNGLPASIRQRFPTSLPPVSVLETLLDKARLEELGAAERVPRPRTVVLESREDIESLSDDYFESAFLKPCESRPFAMQYRVKAFAVADRADALRRFEQVSGDGHRMVLQEYIQGPASEHYLVDGFVDASGELRTILPRRRIRMFPLDFGDSSHIVSVPREELGGAIDGLERLLKTLKYRGIFSAEFKRDPRDHEHKLLEINTRAWTYVEFPLLCGVNVPQMAYLDALGKPVADAFDYEVGKGLTIMPQDMQAGWALLKRGDLTALEFLGSWWRAESLYFRRNDMGPGWEHFRALAKNRLHHLFRRRT